MIRVFSKTGFALWLIVFLFCSCKKERFDTRTDAKLLFSTQIVTFDTIFTSISSVTAQLKVFNPYKNSIKTSIDLLGGSNSYYSININGVSGTQVQDMEIAGNDSLFIFIKINIPPNGGSVPMLVADTLRFITNGNRQNVELLAFGQDANFIVADALYFGGAYAGKVVAHEGEQITWKNTKPYVVYGYAIIDSTATLTIEAGTQVYFHKNSGLWAYTGSCLVVDGTKDNPVVFQGDRTELWYQDDYDQWDRIWLNESNSQHRINYAVIKNATYGIFAGIFQENNMSLNTLKIENSIIKKCGAIGLVTKGFNLLANNNIVTDCVQHCLFLSAGSQCELYNNTIYNQYNNGRSTPAILVSNSLTETHGDGNSYLYYGDVDVKMVNNILSGTQETEIRQSFYPNCNLSFAIDHCLLKIHADSLAKYNAATNNLLNLDPLFMDPAKDKYNFRLLSNSPCRGSGIYNPSAPTSDIEGSLRANPPSIGAYE